MHKAKQYYSSLDKKLVTCPLCDFEPKHQVQLLNNDRYKMGLLTVICSNCSMVFTNPRPTELSLRNFYHNDYRNFYFTYPDPSTVEFANSFIAKNAIKRAEEIFLKLREYFPKGELTVLDVGCGEGALLSRIRKSYQTANLFGFEPSPNYASHAGKVSDATVIVGGLDEFAAACATERFDIITISHVLEHILDPVDLLKRLKNLLKPGGVIYIEVPNIMSTEWNGVGMFHIAHVIQFTPKTITFAVNLAGLSVLRENFGKHLVKLKQRILLEVKTLPDQQPTRVRHMTNNYLIALNLIYNYKLN